MSDARRPTMNDVAARAGVSRALVSIVMREATGASEATRAQVLAAARELGYSRDVSARTLRTGRSGLLGVVFDIRDDFHADLVEACYPAAAARGFGLSLSAVTTGRDQHGALAALADQRVDGVLVLGSRAPAKVLREVAGGVPLVVVGRWSPGLADHAPWGAVSPGDAVDGESPSQAASCGVGVVRTDERAGLHDVVDHLVALRHRDVVYVEATGHPAGLERVQAYREAMQRHGLGASTRVLPGAFTHRAGREAAAQLLGSPRPLPTAVLAANDTCALGVVQTLRAAGVRVPEDVSVVGFDGSRLAAAPDLELSTVAQDSDGLAQLAVAVATGPARATAPAGAAAPHHVLRPVLRLRRTTGPPRAR